jgi:hypothetical protein
VQPLDEFFTLLFQLLNARQRLGAQLVPTRFGLGKLGLQRLQTAALRLQ